MLEKNFRQRGGVAARVVLSGAIVFSTTSPGFAAEPPPLAAAETALAVPRLSAPGSEAGVALPQPLSAPEAQSLRAAFADQSSPIEGLENSALLGHLLADRYLFGPEWTRASTLRTWLERYPDLPEGPALYAMLTTRLAKGETAPPAPSLPAFSAAPFGDDLDVRSPLLPRSPALDRTIHAAAWAGHFDTALRLIARTRMSAEYGALLRAEVAQAMFSDGLDQDALRVATDANRRADGAVGLAGWIGGLAAWRLGRTALAQTLFEAAYAAKMVSPGHRAGAAFWASRASLVNMGERGPWLYRAAQDPQTFYGLLARKTLGQAIYAEDESEETLGEADVEAVAATARGARAFGLLQTGEQALAAAELRLLWLETRERPGFSRSVLVVARAAGLQDLAEQLERAMQPARVRVPKQRLRPEGGFKVSPPLVYALTRLESNFDAQAVSPAGARGLMQLMPATALYISTGRRAPKLHDPATNLALGQQYLLHLKTLDHIGPDLIRMLAAYNAGPGTMSRWLGTIGKQTDPLLFIEALPGEETRAYVPRALAYSWLYAARLGLPSPSLDELAAGQWPRLHTP